MIYSENIGFHLKNRSLWPRDIFKVIQKNIKNLKLGLKVYLKINSIVHHQRKKGSERAFGESLCIIYIHIGRTD